MALKRLDGNHAGASVAAAGHASVKGSMRTTARAPTALAKRWTVRMDGVPLPLSMRATTLWVGARACGHIALRQARSHTCCNQFTGQLLVMSVCRSNWNWLDMSLSP